MEKINIVLACSAGASTSILVRKVIEAGNAKGYEVDCRAYAVDTIATTGKNADVILVGPQAGYLLNQVKTSLPEIPSSIISFQDYGMMDGEKVFQLALDTLKESEENK